MEAKAETSEELFEHMQRVEIAVIRRNMSLLAEFIMNYQKAEKFMSGDKILDAQDELIRICRLVGLPSVFSDNGVEQLPKDFRTVLERGMELIVDRYALNKILPNFDSYLDFAKLSE